MFSKITEYSYEYFNHCFKYENKQPLLILSPSKSNFGISLSAYVLKKKWLEDIGIQNNHFKRGDVIRIAIPPKSFDNKKKINLHAKVESVINDKVKLSFSDFSNTILETRISWFLDFASVESNSNISLSNSEKFRSWINKLQKQNVENNSWSKFLEVDFSVPKEKLTSKVYFISGKNNVEESKLFLNNKGISNSVLLNENLIIKESLKFLAEHFEGQTDLTSKNNFFSIAFLRMFPVDFQCELTEINQSLIDLREAISTNNLNTDDFRIRINYLKELLNKNSFSEFESLCNIVEDYLITVDDVVNLNNIKCIVINDVDLVNNYVNTIKEILKRDIGVIVLNDYANYTIQSKEKINKFKINFPESYCLNWNRGKINVLEGFSLNKDCLDYQVNYFNFKYFNQQISLKSNIDISNEIDNFFHRFEINGALRKIEGYEKLKELYANHLRPVLYFIKNTPGVINIQKDVFEYIKPFVDYLNEIKSIFRGNYSDICEMLLKIINLITDDKPIVNSKLTSALKTDSFSFQQNYESLLKIDFDLENKKNKYSNIVYYGTPLGEVKYRYLCKSIFEDFLNIEFYGFCKETENVYKRFILDNVKFNASLIDKFPDSLQPFWDIKAITNDNIKYDKCEDCLSDDIIVDQNNEDSFEAVQEEIEIKYKYRSYFESNNLNNEGYSREKVNVLELDKMMKIFLPKKRKLKLFCLRNGNDFNGDWERILPGDRVFTYLISRKTNLEMRIKTGQDLSVFGDMDIWFKGLQDLFIQYGNDIKALSNFLKSIKASTLIENANPEVYNIRNWLNPARYINVPEDGNLMVILKAINVTNINEVSKRIKLAERKVRRFDDNNRESIKKEIKKYISRNNISDGNNFTIIVNKVEINVFHGIVVHKIDSNDIEVHSDKIGYITQ